MRRASTVAAIAAGVLAAVAVPILAQPAPSAPPRQEKPSVGAVLYEQGLCGVCHGDDRKGSDNAPPLLGLKTNWDEERLAAYLLDPAKVRAADPRVAKLAARYASLEMPPWEVSEAERRALAAWLLE